MCAAFAIQAVLGLYSRASFRYQHICCKKGDRERKIAHDCGMPKPPSDSHHPIGRTTRKGRTRSAATRPRPAGCRAREGDRHAAAGWSIALGIIRANLYAEFPMRQRYRMLYSVHVNASRDVSSAGFLSDGAFSCVVFYNARMPTLADPEVTRQPRRWGCLSCRG